MEEQEVKQAAGAILMRNHTGTEQTPIVTPHLERRVEEIETGIITVSLPRLLALHEDRA
jgi:hypothetical protein